MGMTYDELSRFGVSTAVLSKATRTELTYHQTTDASQAEQARAVRHVSETAQRVGRPRKTKSPRDRRQSQAVSFLSLYQVRKLLQPPNLQFKALIK
jgi:hypothetical protein